MQSETNKRSICLRRKRFGAPHAGAEPAAMRIGFLCIVVCSVLHWAAVATAADLSTDEARGREIFLTGQMDSAAPTAVIGVGDVKVPATSVPCASCHGRDGRGRTERGVVPPNITWAALMQPSGREIALGRWRSAYSDSLLVRAVTMGIDASGHTLDPVMPRFALSLSEAVALVAYLKRLGSVPEPGLDASSLVLGTVLSVRESALRLVLSAYIDAINRRGGLFGRRLALLVATPRADETAGAAVARLASGDAVFALLAPVIAGDERIAVAAADAHGVPIIGPLTPSARAAPNNRYVFYLNGGMEAEGRALASFAVATRGSPAIVADGSTLWQSSAQAAVDALGDTEPAPRILRSDDAEGVAAALARGGPVLWFADGVRAVLPVATLTGGMPSLLLPSALATDLLASGSPVPTYVAFSTGPPDVTPEAASELAALVSGHDFSPQDRSAQLLALGAAKILVEGLRRAGREVTRERLVDVIEELQNYRTGLVPPVSYSRSRHIGTDGVWIVPLDGSAPVWWDK